MTRRWPEPLGPGSVVAMVAPSGPLAEERVTRGIDRLESWGLEIRVGKHLRGRHDTLSYLAGRDQERADDFMAAWTDPEVAAVWCGRGGYGAQRMVDLLDLDRLRAAGPKHLIGFSDITALHSRIGREVDQVTMHGPIATGPQLDDLEAAEALRRLIFERPDAGMQLLTGEALVGGVASGRLIGGNLALIAADLGIEPRPNQPSIVVMEDVEEESYRIDRMLTQLRRIGWFDHVTGVVLGDFTDGDDPDLIETVLAERLTDLGVPILRRAPFGHARRNLALPLGAEVSLDAEAKELVLA